MVKISVIVPVYNAEQYLHKCVDSILAQTYDNFELLLMDDGSLDASAKICDEYEKKDIRVKVFHLQNGGPSRARNIGIDNATGDLLAFVDSDDYIAQNMLERMVLVIDNADIAMCNFYCSTDGVNRFCDHKMGSMRFDKSGIRGTFMPAFYYSSMTGLGSCWNKLYNIKFITVNNIRFNEKLIRAEDFWFNFECFSRASAVATTDEAFYYYEQVNGNSTMHQIRENQYEDWVYNRKELLRRKTFLEFEIDNNKFYKNFLYNVSVYIRSLLVEGKSKKMVCEILGDDFYLEKIKYDKMLPVHIRFINFITKRNRNISYLVYKIWANIG